MVRDTQEFSCPILTPRMPSTKNFSGCLLQQSGREIVLLCYDVVEPCGPVLQRSSVCCRRNESAARSDDSILENARARRNISA
jgi:hypothetical protein